MISAKIARDSVNPTGNRITTWVLTMPRQVLPEFLSHRSFSRNWVNSPMVSFQQLVNSITQRAVEPVRWLKTNGAIDETDNQIDREQLAQTIDLWHQAKNYMIDVAQNLATIGGCHKSIAGRVLDPWMHVNVVATATEVRNFFYVRCNDRHDSEMRLLAYKMLDSYLKSQPYDCIWGEWHVPFVDVPDAFSPNPHALRVSVARAARESFADPESVYDQADEIRLFMRLLAINHWAPFEHVAQAAMSHLGLDQANFRGWTPYRKMFTEENRDKWTDVDLELLQAGRPNWVKDLINGEDTRNL